MKPIVHRLHINNFFLFHLQKGQFVTYEFLIYRDQSILRRTICLIGIFKPINQCHCTLQFILYYNLPAYQSIISDFSLSSTLSLSLILFSDTLSTCHFLALSFLFILLSLPLPLLLSLSNILLSLSLTS